MQTASPCRDSSCITPPPFPNENYATVFIDYGRIPVTHLPIGNRPSADADLCVCCCRVPGNQQRRCRVRGRRIPFPGCVRSDPGCRDGTLLRRFQERGQTCARAVGIDDHVSSCTTRSALRLEKPQSSPEYYACMLQQTT